MADTSIPVDVPLSPPSYEEAIQTAAPELPNLETSTNDEPPPTYIEATRDDDPNRGYRPMRISNSANASELAGLILASIMNSRRHDEGRQPIMTHSSNDSLPVSNGRSRRSRGAVAVRVPISPFESSRKARLRFCVMGAGLSLFVIAGIIAISYATSKRNLSSQSDTYTPAPVNFDWARTPAPIDWNKYTPADKHHKLFNDYQYSTINPFFWPGKGRDFEHVETGGDNSGEKSSSGSIVNQNVGGGLRPSDKTSFGELLKQLVEEQEKEKKLSTPASNNPSK